MIFKLSCYRPVGIMCRNRMFKQRRYLFKPLIYWLARET